MSNPRLQRRAARRDQNEPIIIEALERVGAVVVQLSIRDVPDLLVGFRGVTTLLEVKSARGDLSQGQADWLLAWKGGPARVVWNVRDALEAIGAIKVILGESAP